MKLSGIVCIRNNFELDYTFKETVESLLGVCDNVTVGDAESTDGTQEFIREWIIKEPRITLCVYPWTNPKNTNLWYPEFINYVRQHAQADHIIHLDSDELLHENDYDHIRRAADNNQTLFLRRLNFWKDPSHLIPEGKCCGTKVLRMAPANMPIPSDYPYAPAEATMKQAVDSNIRVFHYGFLRKREAFFKKARVVQRIWTGGYDPRLEAAEKHEGDWSTMPGVTGWENDLVEYKGSHPEVIKPWLKERGYGVS